MTSLEHLNPEDGRPMRLSLVVLTAALVFLWTIGWEGRQAVAQLYVPNMMQYTDAGGTLQPVANAAQWEIRRQEILGHDTGNVATSTGMQAVMGNLPDRSGLTPANVQVVYDMQVNMGSYTKTTLAYYSEHDGNWVPAVLLQPTAAGVHPAVMALHQTNFDVGKYDAYNMQVAVSLAERGYVVLAPDYPSFGQYTANFTSPDLSTTNGSGNVFNPSTYASGSMKAIADEMRGVDLLQSLPNVDPERIGAIGHSLGGGCAILLGAFDQRVKAIVSSCGWCPFSYYAASSMSGPAHSLVNYSQELFFPRVASVYNNGLDANGEYDPAIMPFDWSESVAALAPRAFLSFAPTGDPYYNIDGVNGVQAAIGTPGSGGIQDVYDLLGAGDNLQARYPDGNHGFTLAMQQEAFDFLDRALAVPEPGGLSMLGIATVGLLAQVWRGKNRGRSTSSVRSFLPSCGLNFSFRARHNKDRALP